MPGTKPAIINDNHVVLPTHGTSAAADSAPHVLQSLRHGIKAQPLKAMHVFTEQATCADALDLMVACSAARQHSALRRLHRNQLQLWLLLLQVAAGAHDCAARAHACGVQAEACQQGFMSTERTEGSPWRPC